MKDSNIQTYYKNKIYKSIFLVFLVTAIAILSYFSIMSSKASTNITLNEKQLILLSNYLYLENADELIPIKDQLAKLKTNGKYNKELIKLPASGINKSKAIEMFKAIEADPVLYDLVPIDSIDDDIRAVCFTPSANVDVKDSDAVLVFLGTKPLEDAWLDCLQGSYQSDTRLQLEAGNFHKKVERDYDVRYVTGHSKGGNLSQYVTLTNGENITRCVSFDGQGFSSLFINKYRRNIEKYKSKVTNISSYKEPVHALLRTVAPNTIYIKTNPDIDPAASHVSSLLCEKKFFDEAGNYKTAYMTQETELCEDVHNIVLQLIKKMSPKALADASEAASPVLGKYIPILQDVIATENISKLKALYYELKESNENNKSNIEYN